MAFLQIRVKSTVEVPLSDEIIDSHVEQVRKKFFGFFKITLTHFDPIKIEAS